MSSFSVARSSIIRLYSGGSEAFPLFPPGGKKSKKISTPRAWASFSRVLSLTHVRQPSISLIDWAERSVTSASFSCEKPHLFLKVLIFKAKRSFVCVLDPATCYPLYQNKVLVMDLHLTIVEKSITIGFSYGRTYYYRFWFGNSGLYLIFVNSNEFSKRPAFVG